MYVEGTVREFANILASAAHLGTKAIHFVAPNMVFMVGNNKKEYLFFKSGLTIRDSVSLGGRGIHNLHIYLKQGKKELLHHPMSFETPASANVVITDDGIQFHGDVQFIISINLPFLPLEKEVELKIEEAITSSFDQDAPYLKIPNYSVLELIRFLKEKKRPFSINVKGSAANDVRVKHGCLAISTEVARQPIEIETGIMAFERNELFASIPHTFSDRSLKILNWYLKTTMIQYAVILHTPYFSIIEGYSNGLVFKVRTMFKSNSQAKKV